jgi:hypothetical protein
MARSGFSGRATNGVNATGTRDGGNVVDQAAIVVRKLSRIDLLRSVALLPANGFELCPIHDLATMPPNLPLE